MDYNNGYLKQADTFFEHTTETLTYSTTIASSARKCYMLGDDMSV